MLLLTFSSEKRTISDQFDKSSWEWYQPVKHFLLTIFGAGSSSSSSLSLSGSEASSSLTTTVLDEAAGLCTKEGSINTIELRNPWYFKPPLTCVGHNMETFYIPSTKVSLQSDINKRRSTRAFLVRYIPEKENDNNRISVGNADSCFKLQFKDPHGLQTLRVV